MDKGTAATLTALWPEGDGLIDKAFRFVAERYQALSWQPIVVGDEWTRREAVINEAYATHDREQLLEALRAWARFALAEFKRPVSA
jgi:hypothetical protein